MLGKHMSQRKKIKGLLLNYSVQYLVCSPLVFITDLSPWNIVYIFLANRRQAFPGVHNTFLQLFFVHAGAFSATICLIHSKFLCLYLNQVTVMAKALKLRARAESHCSYEEFYLLKQGLKDCSSDLWKKNPSSC